MIDAWINHTPNRLMFDVKVIHIDESTLLNLSNEEVQLPFLSFFLLSLSLLFSNVNIYEFYLIPSENQIVKI
jgi:hypothetical protein